MKSAATALLLFAASTVASSGAESALFVESCAKCHGPKGEGNAEIKAPSIAGQPLWYTLAQLGKFRKDMRGTDAADPAGALMHAVALQLNEAAMREVAAHIANLAPIPTASTLGGDASRGRLLFEEHCMECHRYNGTGEEVFKSPSLIAYQDWYIVGQLKKFRQGQRGAHPRDEEGAKMHRITGFLEGEEDFTHIAAYIAVLAAKHAK